MIKTTPQVERRANRLEVRVAQSGDRNTLTGYIAVFNSPSEDLCGFTEMVMPGAFTSALSSDTDIVALINHDDDAVVGRRSAGTLRLEQDSTGLRFEIDLPQTTRANDLKISIERKDVTGCSFGFICRDQEWIENEDGSILRILKEVDLIEVSVGVTFPAYSDTNSQLRSLPESMPLEIRSRLEGSSTSDPKIAAWVLDHLLRVRIAEAE